MYTFSISAYYSYYFLCLICTMFDPKTLNPANQTSSGGPAGSVIEAAVAKVGSARASEVGRAADLLEEPCFSLVQGF